MDGQAAIPVQITQYGYLWLRNLIVITHSVDGQVGRSGERKGFITN